MYPNYQHLMSRIKYRQEILLREAEIHHLLKAQSTKLPITVVVGDLLITLGTRLKGRYALLSTQRAETMIHVKG